MAVLVKHAKTSAIADIGDASLVQPSDWNANHTVTGLGSMAEANTADYAPLASPVFTGDPRAPTPAAGDEDTSIATTAFVQSTVDSSIGTIGLLGYFDYTFNNAAFVAPPSAGNFRMNNADQTLVTHIYVHEQTAPANDAALMLALIQAGDKLLMQRKSDAAKWRRYTVVSSTDAGAYWDFTVTYVDGGAALDNARTAVIVQKASGGGGVDAYTKTESDAKYLPFAGGTITGYLQIRKADPWFDINKLAAGQASGFGGKLNGVSRWDIQVGDNAAETGSNAGSNFSLTAYTDAGAWLHNPIEVNRATGTVNFIVTPTINGTPMSGGGGQPLDATLTALAGLNATAGLVEQTGTDVFTKRLIGVANTTDIPTRANGDARWQTLDATLTALAGLNTTAGLVEQTGTDTFTKATVTTFGKSLIDDADAGTAQTTLGISTFVKTILDDADAAAVRATLGVGSMATRAITVSTSDPSGGADGDVWFKV